MKPRIGILLIIMNEAASVARETFRPFLTVNFDLLLYSGNYLRHKMRTA